MWEKTVVAYLDMLGYQSLVDSIMEEPAKIAWLENLFFKSSVDAIKQLAKIDLEATVAEPDVEIQEYYKKVVKTIKVRCIADCFVFILPISEVNFRCSAYDEKTTVMNCIETYFKVMTLFALHFISFAFGHLLRGGISIGKHYESEREDSLFIVSPAHNKACKLEKEIAQSPRIILDKAVLLYLMEISYPHINEFFYRDDDGYYCLDIYKGLNIFQRKEEVLSRIKQGITFQIEQNWHNKKNLHRLITFAKYHNRWVNSALVNISALAIADISKYEERYKLLKNQKKRKRG